ncbi:hypothetical protein FVEG_15584 [Fusarium verticillioides 7600]|uniref:Uncharacterized protein n=1 Tax=Gibberella moniliformis (strain M3125 / FGSC 7600) TaxID=334819 RepID=W7M7L3_GIBM7|nr:hypothetical protein FVEG_15584 [Fusarium verticillioides 7600]EWG43595.1 hypothetical protein FVEG_15584 [Fusarium verticillioides 7600]
MQRKLAVYQPIGFPSKDWGLSRVSFVACFMSYDDSYALFYWKGNFSCTVQYCRVTLSNAMGGPVTCPRCIHTYLGSVSPQLLRSYTNPVVSHDLFDDDGQSFLQNLNTYSS